MQLHRAIHLFWLLVALPAAGAIVRGPYLQSASHERVTLCWRTDVATDSRAQIEPSAGGSLSETTVPGTRTEHRIEFTGLASDTRYDYRVGDSSALGTTHSFLSSPSPGQSAPRRIWVLGDVGSGLADEALVRDAFYGWNGSPSADLVLLLGDNAYDTGTDQEFQTRFFEPHAASLAGSPLWPAFGNHDGASSDGVAGTGPYFDAFELPVGGECGGLASGHEAYYSFDVGDVHFLCVDSHANDKSAGSTMAQWIAADLALPAVQAATWRIAFWHHPPYSKGSHDSDSEWGMIQMRENIVPVLEAGGVDLVLSGHSHGYERSMLIDGHYGLSGTLTQEMLLDDGDGNGAGGGVYRKAPSSAPHSGTVYVVAGSSGRLSQLGTLDHPVMKRSLRSLGSVILDVDGPQLDLRFLDGNGVVRDGFTMLRTASTASPVAVGQLRVLASPARGTLRLAWSGDGPREATIRVFDLRGRLVDGPFDWRIASREDERELRLDALASGRYFALVRSGGDRWSAPFVLLP